MDTDKVIHNYKHKGHGRCESTHWNFLAHVLHVATTVFICILVCCVSGIKHHHITMTSLDDGTRAHCPQYPIK
ncbi:MAG TPA: hypothetical protein VER14_05585 [Phototrophicaceae bacterium]|nr:hypothetical protein [Phototrophicaceae bacterium]